MKKILMIPAVLLVGVFASNVRAVNYKDGQSHDIDYMLNEDVIIYNHSHNIDEPTTVNLLSGGTVDGVDVYDSSFFNLFDGGKVNYSINSHNDSRVNISGGAVSDLMASEYSQVSMSGGYVNSIGAVGNSTVDVTGGSTWGFSVVNDNATVNVSNAHIEYGGNLGLRQNASLSLTNTTFGSGWPLPEAATYDNSHFTVSTGTSFDRIMSHNTSAVTVSGGEVDTVNAVDSSRVDISSGSTVGSLNAEGTSEVTMTGGHVNRLDGYEDSTVDVTGGSIGYLRVEDDSAVSVSNAHIGGIWSYLRQNSLLSLTNTTFNSYSPPHNMLIYDNSHLTLGTGTSFGFIWSYNNSKVTISGGSMMDVLMWDSSQLEMSDGTVDRIGTRGNSQVNISISGGTVTRELSAGDYSQVIMSGGTIDMITTWGSSHLEMSGGEVHYFNVGGGTADITSGSIWELTAHLDGVAHISGGTLNTVSVGNTGRIIIEGRGFNYDYGYIQDTTGALTGMLSNGDMISVSFYRDIDEASILLIPAPEHSPVACIADVNDPVEAQGPFGAKVTLDGSCSSDADSTPGTNDDINDFNWYEIDPCNSDSDVFLGSGQVIDCNLPLGSHTIVLEVTDKAGATDSNEITITIEDTTPPEFNLFVTPKTLWPVNHKMIKITPTCDVNDFCDPSPEISLVDITANEPCNPNDIKIASDGSIYLCATRSGNSKGRIYTLTYQACDSSANCTTRSATVTVPHDNRK